MKNKDQEIAEPAAIYGIHLKEKKKQQMGVAKTVACILNGLPMIEFEGLRELLNLSAETLADHLNISRSTLVRRRKANRLDAQESDRLLRYARLYARCEEVMGDATSAQNWLQKPARGLDFNTPLGFAETEAGANEVFNLLGRIEHGVFS